jgi:hypothetical protein
VLYTCTTDIFLLLDLNELNSVCNRVKLASFVCQHIPRCAYQLLGWGRAPQVTPLPQQGVKGIQPKCGRGMLLTRSLYVVHFSLQEPKVMDHRVKVTYMIEISSKVKYDILLQCKVTILSWIWLQNLKYSLFKCWVFELK